MSEITKLPLAKWGEYAGIHPLHLYGISTTEIQAGPFSCGTVWSQHEWQKTDAVSRDEVLRAIRSAEDDIEDVLGHHLIPTWDYGELVRLPRPYRSELVWTDTFDFRGFPHGFFAKWGHFIDAGFRHKELIDDPVNPTPITWDAADADSGWPQFGTVTVNTTVTDPEEIHVYYPGENGDDEFEIRPVQVSISGGVATIRIRRELCALQSLYNSMLPFTSPIDGSNDANFTGSVDVYRVYNDPSVNAQLIWEYDNITQSGRIFARDNLPSLLSYEPANYVNGAWSNCISICAGRNPDSLRAWYRSGWVNPRTGLYNEMDPLFARAVAMLSIARLNRPPCGCMQEAFTEYQMDLSVSGGGNTVAHQITDEELANPLGTKRGAVNAWRIISRFPSRNPNRTGVIA